MDIRLCDRCKRETKNLPLFAYRDCFGEYVGKIVLCNFCENEFKQFMSLNNCYNNKLVNDFDCKKISDDPA